MLIPEEVLRALPTPAPASEDQLWAAMTPEQRKLTLRRILALEKWQGDRGDWTVDDAAKAAKLSRSRFYRIAMEWEDEESRSLRLLGVQASAPRRRSSRYGEELKAAAMEAAARLVALNKPGSTSVSSLCEQLRNVLSQKFKEVPGNATLRTIILEARRQANLADTVGSDLAFDVCACSIADPEHRPHRIFVCIDRGTGIILGTAVGDPADSRAGHRAAAEDAMRWIASSQAEAIPWAERIARFEFVIGTDLAPSRSWEAMARASLGGINVNGSNRPRRFGRYLKEHLGVSIGRIRLLPSLTLGGEAAPASLTRESFNSNEAKARLDLEVADHNRLTLGRLQTSPAPVPESVLRVLHYVAHGD